jgi:hypothetical protein
MEPAVDEVKHQGLLERESDIVVPKRGKSLVVLQYFLSKSQRVREFENGSGTSAFI